MTTVLNFVDGAEVPASGSRTLDLTDPATGEVFGTSVLSEQSDVDAALEAADRAS